MLAQSIDMRVSTDDKVLRYFTLRKQFLLHLAIEQIFLLSQSNIVGNKSPIFKIQLHRLCFGYSDCKLRTLYNVDCLKRTGNLVGEDELLS